MSLISKYFFLITLLVIAFLEGLGFYYGHEISFFVVILLPFFLFISSREKNKKILIPRGFLFFGLFIFLSLLSTFFSINIANSIRNLIFYLSMFLISIYAFNYKKDFERYLVKLLLFLSLFFLAFSILNLIFPLDKILPINPGTGFSIFYSRANYHNNIGDFLIIPITILYFSYLKRRKSLFDGLFLFISSLFFLLSYSRSGYVSLATTLLVMIFFNIKKLNKKNRNLFFLIIGMILFFFFVSVANFHQYFLGLSWLNIFRKPFLGDRLSFFIPAIKSIIQRPLWGVGLGNFKRISYHYNDIIFFWSRSAFNILLEFFSGSGIPAGLSFLVLIFLALKNNKKNVYFYIFLSLFLNFQSYYSYDIYLVSLIFFVLLGLIYKQKRIYELDNSLVISMSFISIVFFQMIFLSSFFVQKGNYYLAFIFNPLNKNVYPKLITKSRSFGNYKNNLRYRKLYGQIYSSNPEVNDYLAILDLEDKNEKKALKKFKQSLLWGPFDGDIRLRLLRFYRLSEKLKGTKHADRYLLDYTKKVKKMKAVPDLGYKVKDDLVRVYEELEKPPPHLY